MKPINKKISNLIDKRNKIVTVGCFCGKRFGREENLNTHSKKHEGKNFICAECDKTFRTKKVFTNHLRLHKRTQIIEYKFCGDKKAAIDIAIAEEEASENRDLIMKQFKFLSENPENIVMQKMWKVLKTICPKQKPNLPTAKKNFKGNGREISVVFKGISRVFQGVSNKVLRMLQGRLKGVSMEFLVSFKVAKKKLNGSLREVSKVFQG